MPNPGAAHASLSEPAAGEQPASFVLAAGALASCARKTDAARWGRLFGAIGPPRALLRACLAEGEVEHAAMLLLPLLEAEGVEACAEALREVRGAATDDPAILEQLSRFEARLEGEADESLQSS